MKFEFTAFKTLKYSLRITKRFINWLNGYLTNCHGIRIRWIYKIVYRHSIVWLFYAMIITITNNNNSNNNNNNSNSVIFVDNLGKGRP